MKNIVSITAEDIQTLLDMVEIVKKNTKEESLSYNLLSEIKEYITKNLQIEQVSYDKPNRPFADGNWKWTPKRKAEQSKRMRKFWKDRREKLKAKKTIWTEERKKELGKTMKKLWKKRKIQKYKRKNKTWTTKEDKFIIKELKAGTTQKNIAKALDVNIPLLKHRIRKIRGKE